MPTVAILTTSFFPYGQKDHPIVHSGGDRYLVELCRMFRDKGWDALVVQAGDSEWETTYEGFVIRGIPGTTFDYETNPQLNRIFNEMALSADLRVYFAPFTCFPRVISPCISVSHGIWWDYPDHPLGNGPEEIKIEYMRRIRFGHTACDAMVACDTTTIEFVRATWPGEEKKMQFVPNFVDTALFYPRKEEKTWTRPRVLYPRRLTSLRGSNEFLWAVKQLPKVDFWLVGHGDEKADELRMAEICKAYSNLKWLKCSFDEMPEIYRQVDLALIPTRAAEGTSLSCLEAMVSGLPVIATNVGGLGNLIIDGYNGFFVNLYTTKLHEKIREVLNNPETMVEAGRRGADMARAFDLKVWRKKWWQVVNEVI